MFSVNFVSSIGMDQLKVQRQGRDETCKRLDYPTAEQWQKKGKEDYPTSVAYTDDVLQKLVRLV